MFFVRQYMLKDKIIPIEVNKSWKRSQSCRDLHSMFIFKYVRSSGIYREAWTCVVKLCTYISLLQNGKLGHLDVLDSLCADLNFSLLSVHLKKYATTAPEVLPSI